MSKSTASALILGGVPRADLLPPEVHARAKSNRTHRMLVLAVVASLVLAGGAYGLATLQTRNAQAALAAEQERTAELLAEQLEYAEATTTADLVDTLSDTRSLATSGEVLWNDVVDDVQSYLPPEVAVVTISTKSPAPWEPQYGPSHPLRYASVAEVELGVASASVIDATELVRQLSAMPGFLDAVPYGVGFADGLYATGITMTLHGDTLSGRYQGGSEADDVVVEEPTVTETDASAEVNE